MMVVVSIPDVNGRSYRLGRHLSGRLMPPLHALLVVSTLTAAS